MIDGESLSQEEYTKYWERKNVESNSVADSKEENKSNAVEIQRPKVTADKSVGYANSLDIKFLKNGRLVPKRISKIKSMKKTLR